MYQQTHQKFSESPKENSSLNCAADVTREGGISSGSYGNSESQCEHWPSNVMLDNQINIQ